MSAIATEAGGIPSGIERRVARPAWGLSRGRIGGRIALAIGLLLVGALALANTRLPAATGQEAPALPALGASAPVEGLVEMPSAPVDGVLTMVIPRGAAADQQAGGRGYIMPSVIHLTVGDTIVIRNDDDAPHMILYTFLMPGETDERTFTEVDSEVYSSGCGLHAAAILNFTTIFVGEPRQGAPAV